MQLPKTHKGAFQLLIDICDWDTGVLKDDVKEVEIPDKLKDCTDYEDSHHLLRGVISAIQNELGENAHLLDLYNLKENDWYKKYELTLLE